MSSTDDLILTYERRLADFESRLAAIERERDRRPGAVTAPIARSPAGAGYRLGVDVGGTFTDLLLVEREEWPDLEGEGSLDARRPSKAY